MLTKPYYVAQNIEIHDNLIKHIHRRIIMSETYVMVPASEYRRPRRLSKQEEELNKKGSSALGLGIASFAIALYTLYVQFCCLALYIIPITSIFMFFFVNWFFVILYIVSIILGANAISRGKKAKSLGKGRTGKGFGTAGLVISIIFLVLSILVPVLAILFLFTAGIIAIIVYAFLFIVSLVSSGEVTALSLLGLLAL